MMRRIADRIDERHERALADADLCAAPTEAQLSELGYVKLPVDADGVPIHVGDELEIEHNGRVTTVDVMTLLERGWTVYCTSGGAFVPTKTRCHHVQPDSWERIIRDAIAEGFERTDISAPCEVGNDELVERCRRLAGEGA